MANTRSVNVQDASPKRLLVTWANTQDAWLRSLVAETILSRQPPADEHIDGLFGTFLAEKGISGESLPDVPLLEFDDREETAEESLELISVNKIVGVNALAAGYDVEFDGGLTILFGQNGSGKTGYARIIKRLAAVRTAEPILPNVDATGPQPSPSARIKYRLGSEEQEITWANQAGLVPFTRISVFDLPAANLHVDNELNYVFTPAELALFSHVAEGIRLLQKRISEEISELRPGTNPLLPQFSRGTSVYPIIESLGPTTDISELERLATLAEDATQQRDRLQEEVSALRGGALDALLTTAQQRSANLERLRDVAKVIGSFNATAYNTALDTYRQAEGERKRAREELFSEDELPGQPDDEWQRFVASGEEYRLHLNLHEYPTERDRCLYCRQPLTQEALALVRRYRKFLDESLVRQVTGAAERLNDLVLRLNATRVSNSQEYLTSLASDGGQPTWLRSATSLVNDAMAVAETTAEHKRCQVSDLTDRANLLVESLDPEIETANEAVTDLTTQKNDRAATLARKQKELDELSARIDLRKHLATARSFVVNAKVAARLEQLSKQMSNNVLRQLTEQSKLASEDLVNKNFERLFTEECEALRAPTVVLEFQGRSGKAERRKVVAKHRPSEILSEGEQKVLALADFLAESRMRGTKAPIVFDDPVTSLDYRRLEEVASRIARLAESHQVIVFTHNIMFASTLIGMRQGKKLRCKFYEVRDSGDSKGILAPDVEPRLDTPAEIGKRINSTIQAAGAADSVVQDALVERGYDLLRAWCEVFVEQELLNNVTQRYRANIMMTRLGAIHPERFATAATDVSAIFDKACRCMGGHSQPAEQLNIRPTVAELKEDWAKLQDVRRTYLSAQ